MDESQNSAAISGGLAELEYLNSNLQDSIKAASSQAKALLCFVTDDSEMSQKWEQLLRADSVQSRLQRTSIALRISASSQEAHYLSSIHQIKSVPAVVMIKQGQVRLSLQAGDISFESFKESLLGTYESEAGSRVYKTGSVAHDAPSHLILPSSAGRMRLPNNAYDALSAQTEQWSKSNVKTENILELQLRLLRNIGTLQDEVQAIESRQPGSIPVLSEDAQTKLLNTPGSLLRDTPASGSTIGIHARTPTATPTTPTTLFPRGTPASVAATTTTAVTDSAASTAQPAAAPSTAVPTVTATSANATVKQDYRAQQRARESAERAERERIKAQIAADRDARRATLERNRYTQQAQADEATRRPTISRQSTRSVTSDIRVLVRAFDGQSFRNTFPTSATITHDVRPWVDDQVEPEKKIPYNLKIIMTPLPNKMVETSEEEQMLSDLGLQTSVTMVMVPVKGFVDSYTASGGVGIFGTITGLVGGIVGGVGSLFGFGASPGGDQQDPGSSSPAGSAPEQAQSQAGPTVSDRKVRVRTLADQRADEASKQSNELYNGNQLNFQPRKEDVEDKKHD